jgi:uncharacterized protein YndB with AHSA1/START domain
MTSQQQEIAFTRMISAPPQQVFRAFTSAEGWTSWCCETAEVDASIGVGYHIYTQGYNASGKFTRLEPDRAAEFTWEGDNEPPVAVKVLLDGQENGTLLTFTVTVLDSLENYPGFIEFLDRTWSRVLDNLKAVLEAASS